MKKEAMVVAGTLSLVVAVGLYVWLGASSGVPLYTPPTAEPPGKGVTGRASTDKDSFDITVTYTDQGFSPRGITVRQGERVRFLNASKTTFWPASGVHPTHTLYPEKEATDCLGSTFDACKGLAPGEFYDFTFYYVGSWPFHDHLQAFNTGSVTVTASSTVP